MIFTLSRKGFKASRSMLFSMLAVTVALPSVLHADTAETPVPEAEQAFTHKMELPSTEWFFVRGGFGSTGTSIFDGKTGKMRGMVETSKSSDMAIDPKGQYYYVSETIWSKGDRGTRQDMVSVYDSIDMKLQAEIPMPGRLIIGGRKQNFVLSDDGKMGFVYNMDPSSSVNVIDLVKRKFVRAIELPGCASLMANPDGGFSALCGDGSLATSTVAGKITRTAPFFNATTDPIFDNYTYDKAKKEAVFLTYTGLIYQAKMGATPTVSEPWSIQQAAGVRIGDTKPLDVNWYPGGAQPMALHRKSGHLYVLMHMGEYWTQKENGTEIWDVDLAAKKVVKRIPLENPANDIEVSQSDTPLLFLNERKGGTGLILDAKTAETKFKIEKAGGGLIAALDPS